MEKGWGYTGLDHPFQWAVSGKIC